MLERNTDKERWEAYLMMILMATRPFLLMGGVIMLFYGIAFLSAYPIVGGIALGFALFLLLMVLYDWVTLYVARFGAWLITFGRSG